MSWSGSRHMFGRMFARDDQDKLRLTEIAALEPIDCHTHIALTTPEFVAMQQRLHVRVLDILLGNDRQPDRATLSSQKQDALKFVTYSIGHAQILHDIRSVCLQSCQLFAPWRSRNSAGEYINFDDPILQPIYREIAAHNKTLIVHAADLKGPDVDDVWCMNA